MKQVLLILCIVFYATNLVAQETNSQPKEQEETKVAQTIEALKIAYITKQLELTPDEAQKFWPVYNGYSDEIKKAHQELKQDEVAFEEKKVAIMKKYKEEFKKVFTNNDKRINKCFKVEPEFRKALHAEIIRRRNIRMQKPADGKGPQPLNAVPKPRDSKGPNAGGGVKPANRPGKLGRP